MIVRPSARRQDLLVSVLFIYRHSTTHSCYNYLNDVFIRSRSNSRHFLDIDCAKCAKVSECLLQPPGEYYDNQIRQPLKSSSIRMDDVTTHKGKMATERNLPDRYDVRELKYCKSMSESEIAFRSSQSASDHSMSRDDTKSVEAFQELVKSQPDVLPLGSSAENDVLQEMF